MAIETTGVYGKSTAPFLSGLAKRLVDVSGDPREHQLAVILPIDYGTNKRASVYFTADFLAATDRLELLCRQSDAIRMKRSVLACLHGTFHCCFWSIVAFIF